MKICSSLIRSASFPSCLRKAKALTKSVKSLVMILLQSVFFLWLRSAR